MLRASQWKPAKVMNCQQKPNLALGHGWVIAMGPLPSWLQQGTL
jgi:hypothetical protein